MSSEAGHRSFSIKPKKSARKLESIGKKACAWWPCSSAPAFQSAAAACSLFPAVRFHHLLYFYACADIRNTLFMVLRNIISTLRTLNFAVLGSCSLRR